MTERSRLVQSVAAGVGVFAVCVWPVVLIWRAGRSGSVGDLPELRFLGFVLVYSVVLAAIAARLMWRALASAATSELLGRFDPWGAYALGVGVLAVALTAVPAIVFGLVITDEDQSLRSRQWLIALVWIAGHVLAAALGVMAGRALLRPRATAPRR